MSWFRTKAPTVTVNLNGEAATYGIGPVPNRTDGVVALHVGSQYVILSPQEADLLINKLYDLVEEYL